MVQFAVGTNRLTARTMSRHRHLFGGIALTSALLGVAGEPYTPAAVDAVLGGDDVVLRAGDGSVIATAPTDGDLAAAAVSPPAAS